MLRQLRINQLVLVDSADIPFHKGLQVVTGETGSGKSAVLGALHLVMGNTADLGLIRRGASKACVEAVFDVDQQEEVTQLLAEAGIEQDADEYLIIRRELHLDSKSRTYINNRLASASLLRAISPYLLDIVTQHANTRLLSLDYHRRCLDAYAGTKSLLVKFQQAWKRERSLRQQLQESREQEAARLREMEVCRMEIEELTDANLQDGEEEELFSEFTRLANADSLQKLLSGLLSTVSDGNQAVLPKLAREKGALTQLVEMDPTLEEGLKSFESVLLELEELGYTLRNYQAGIAHDPIRLAEVDERLSLLNRLKRKYGSTIGEVQNYLAEREARLSELENADELTEALEKELAEAEDETTALAQKLTTQRTKAATKLSSSITQEIKHLNMPKAELKITISQTQRTMLGEDEVEFCLAPNVGERFVSLKDGISGGEIARVMLALKRVLAGMDSVATLVFDEVDANIGGKTASIIGETLQQISEKHQVLCITHFPQVARCADHHLRIAKQETRGRTVTTVAVLDGDARETELARMRGGVEELVGTS